MMSGRTLQGYYTTLHAMCQHHHWSLRDLEDAYPYEVDIYRTMTLEFLKKKQSQQ